ncbi:hypothetical protein N7510_008026 [Penicillium lagena]|uniref:uncharacterized protein n=1 Tax=Penicillium lagena TaxID=94218 RepID=UPI00253FF216|nr:uncharacterized protein N7510_008026 [Penicillium lagena]KAJ5611307.1 hypothetical protein N7510_008026 [Penicillium lagena]
MYIEGRGSEVPEATPMGTLLLRGGTCRTRGSKGPCHQDEFMHDRPFSGLNSANQFSPGRYSLARSS